MGSGASGPSGGETGDQGAGSGGTVDAAKQKATEAASTVKEQLAGAATKASGVASQATEAAGVVKEQLSGVAAKASDITSQATEQAAGGLQKAAEMLREQGGEGGGPVVTVADKLESASGMLQGVSGGGMTSGLASTVRSKPNQALLVAVGVGFLLSKVTR
jgi:hypothetical protein